MVSNSSLPFAPVFPDVSEKKSEVVVDDKIKNPFTDVFADSGNLVDENAKNNESFALPAENVTNNSNVEPSMKILKLKADKVKAILVSKKQIDKLKASKELQKNALDFGVVQSDNNNTVSNISDIQSSQAQIEELMNKASALYKEGKVQEAQELYAKISELNKNISN